MFKETRSLALGMAVLASLSYLANAATVDKTVNITSGTTTGSMSLSGTLYVAGQNMKVTLSSAPILGTPISASADIILPPQTQSISFNPNPTLINNPTTGSFVLRAEDNYIAVGPDPNDGGDYQLVPGSDGLIDDGSTQNSMMDVIVQSVNLGLINQNLQTTNVNLNGTAVVDILGITSINFPISIVGAASGNLSASFNSTAPSGALILPTQDNSTFADGDHPYINPSNPSVAAVPDGVENFGVQGIFISPGDILAALQASLNGTVTIDLGIFGSVTQNLSNLVSFNELLQETFLILGQLTARQIPTPSLLSDDLEATIAFDFADIVSGDIFVVPLELMDSQVFNLDFDVPVANLGIFGSVTLDGNFTGTIHFNLNATATLTPPSYTATGYVANAINVPEANTMILLGIVGAAGLLVRYRRSRASA